jgi:hypothetical protein
VAGEAELSLEVRVDEGRDPICLSGRLTGHVVAPAIGGPDRQVR